jgi:nucleotide-binding universal stress UspA family protein
MYQKILIATDGSGLATEGLVHGLDLAKTLEIPAVIVTTTETWSAIDMAAKVEAGEKDPFGPFEKAAAAEAQAILSQAADEAKKRYVECETVHVADKHPADGILETAKAKGCGLIVIASHGRRGIRRALLGSVANEVATQSEVPVLIVR